MAIMLLSLPMTDLTSYSFFNLDSPPAGQKNLPTSSMLGQKETSTKLMILAILAVWVSSINRCFANPFETNVALSLQTVFIEGPKKERLNKPYVLYLKDGLKPFAFAGIWDEWVNKETGEILQSYAIITTVSNELTQIIGHHRLPVILPQE